MLKVLVKNATALFWIQVVIAGLVAAAKASGKVNQGILDSILAALGVTAGITGYVAPAPQAAQAIHNNGN